MFRNTSEPYRLQRVSAPPADPWSVVPQWASGFSNCVWREWNRGRFVPRCVLSQPREAAGRGGRQWRNLTAGEEGREGARLALSLCFRFVSYWFLLLGQSPNRPLFHPPPPLALHRASSSSVSSPVTPSLSLSFSASPLRSRHRCCASPSFPQSHLFFLAATAHYFYSLSGFKGKRVWGSAPDICSADYL